MDETKHDGIRQKLTHEGSLHHIITGVLRTVLSMRLGQCGVCNVRIANVKQQRVHNEMTHMLSFHNCLLRAGCTKIFWVQVDTIGNGNTQGASFCICHKYVTSERNTFSLSFAVATLLTVA